MSKLTIQTSANGLVLSNNLMFLKIKLNTLKVTLIIICPILANTRFPASFMLAKMLVYGIPQKVNSGNKARALVSHIAESDRNRWLVGTSTRADNKVRGD